MGALGLSAGAVVALAPIASLAAPGDGGPAHARALSAFDAARLGRITSDRRRAEFLAGRALLNRLLVAVLGAGAGDCTVTGVEDGPPHVPECPALHLALSHSGPWVAAAVSDAPAGLDVETPGRPRDLPALVAAVCTPAEQARLAVGDAAEREAAFREAWTLKEAWLKRRGEGVAPQRLAALDTRPGGQDAWTWSAPELTLAWVHAGRPPRFWPDAGPLSGIPAVGWRVLAGAVAAD